MYRTLIGAVFICLLPSAAYVAEYSGLPLASGTEGTVKIGVPADKTTNNIAQAGARDDGPAIRVAADDDYFTFKVCNKSKYDAQVAISHRVDPSSKDFYVRGWYFVDAGECATIGDYPSGWFYHYAENRDDNTQFWGGEFDLCVSYKKFTWINEGGSCDKDLLKPFVEKDIKPGTYTWTLND